MPNRGVTIVDLANKLQLSPTTVSYVVRGKAKKLGVSEETTRRVRKAARELGYVPNHLARGLLSGKTGIVSALIPAMGAMDWIEMVLRGMEDVMVPANYLPLVVRQNPRYLEIEEKNYQTKGLASSILARRDEGIICHPNNAFKKDYTIMAESGTPIVFFGTLPKDMNGLEKVSTVIWDCGPPVKTALNHLIKLGRRRIAFVGANHDHQADETRYEAYMKTLIENDIEPNKDHVIWWSPYPAEKIVGSELLTEMFENNKKSPDAIFALNDSIAIKVLEILDSIGVSVPDDCAVIGMGNYQVTGLHGVSLSTMEEPMEQLGRQAARLLLQLISQPGCEPIHKRISWNKLIARRSTLGTN